MHKDVLFRGCTRPAMFLGVPYMPFFIAAGSCILMTFYFNAWFLAALPPILFVMRQMARRDEMIFRMLGLRWSVRMRMRNMHLHDGNWVLTPNLYRDPRDKKHR